MPLAGGAGARQAGVPAGLTWVERAWEAHALQVVVATLFVFLQRAPLFIASATISTFVRLTNCRRHNGVRDPD